MRNLAFPINVKYGLTPNMEAGVTFGYRQISPMTAPSRAVRIVN
jgi:hypothetical protein